MELKWRFVKGLNLTMCLFILMTLLGCLKESNETTLPDEQEVIVISSTLAQQLLMVASLDGSGDNIIDNASCLTVVYPVVVRLKETQIKLESADDLPMLLDLYEDEITDREQFQILFPIVVRKSDHSPVTINSQNQLDLLTLNCIEGGSDEDNECIDFVYPIRVSTYDPLNQLADVVRFENDEALYHFFSTASADLLVSFNYPLHLITFEGDEIMVSDNEALENTLTGIVDACDEGDQSFHHDHDQPKTGYLQLRMTDAPFPTDLVSEVRVNMSKLEIKGKTDHAGNSTITLFEGEFPMNLLELTNGLTATLAEVNLPEGNYASLHLYLDQAIVIMKNGEEFELKIPGGPNADIKINLNPSVDVVAGDTTQILLDFDVSQSFVVQGNPNSPQGIKGFLFKPVIHATDQSKTGRLQGMITDEATKLPVEGVQVAVYENNGKLATTTFTNNSGEFMILSLKPGRYSLLLERQGYLSANQDGVTIAAGETTPVNFLLESE